MREREREREREGRKEREREREGRKERERTRWEHNSEKRHACIYSNNIMSGKRENNLQNVNVDNR